MSPRSPAYILLLVVFAVAVGSGCSQTDLPPYATSLVGTPIPTATASRAEPVSPAATTQKPIEAGLDVSCVTIVDSMVLPESSVLVLADPGLQSDVRLLRLEGLSTSALAKAYMPVAVSQDQKRLAFVEPGRGLVVVGADGGTISAIPAPSDWHGVVSWAGGQDVFVERMPYFGGSIDPPARLLRANVATGIVEEFPELPGLKDAWGGADFLPWGSFAMVGAVPDGQGHLVAHVSVDETGKDRTGILTLTSFTGLMDLARLVGGIYSFGGGPRWTSGGERFYVSAPVRAVTLTGYDLSSPVNSDPAIPSQGGNELFSVSRDGAVSRLTFLTTVFVAGEDGVSVSPDGNRVAFWLDRNYRLQDETPEQSFAILDLETGRVTDYCLSSAGWPAGIYWSPDGRYVALTQTSAAGHDTQVIVVDLAAGTSTTVGVELFVVGWMTL